MTVKRQKLQQKRTQRGAPVQDLPLPRKPLRAWARDELLPPRTITGLMEPWRALNDWCMLRLQYLLPRTRGDEARFRECWQWLTDLLKTWKLWIAVLEPDGSTLRAHILISAIGIPDITEVGPEFFGKVEVLSQVGTATFHKYDRGRTMAWNLRHIRRPGVITAGTTLGFPVHRLARQFAPSLACPFRATRQSQVHRRPRRPQHTRPAHNTR